MWDFGYVWALTRPNLSTCLPTCLSSSTVLLLDYALAKSPLVYSLIECSGWSGIVVKLSEVGVGGDVPLSEMSHLYCPVYI